MFGYYIIKCWRSSNLSYDLEKDNPYWKLFHELAIQMEELDTKKLDYNRFKLL